MILCSNSTLGIFCHFTFQLCHNENLQHPPFIGCAPLNTLFLCVYWIWGCFHFHRSRTTNVRSLHRVIFSKLYRGFGVEFIEENVVNHQDILFLDFVAEYCHLMNYANLRLLTSEFVSIDKMPKWILMRYIN